MSRYKYQSVAKDGNGKVIQSATVSVFLAGTSTPASVYVNESGGVAVNSVTTDSSDGSFSFWVDNTDYLSSQRFKVTVSKSSFRTKSYDDIDIILDDNPSVYPEWFGAVGDGVTDDSAAFQSALTYLGTLGGGNLRLSATYGFSSSAFLDGVDNVSIVGDGGSKVLKLAGFSGEYLIYFKSCENIRVSGVIWQGLTTATGAGLVSGEDGLGFFSVNFLRVIGNKFINFGDAALHIKTYDAVSTPATVDSHNSTVSGNYFKNCHQTSTTTGGTESFIFAGNFAENLKGSFKFASRSDGAGKLIIKDNIVKVSKSNGIEVVSNTDVEVSGNILEDIVDTGINFYNNSSVLPGNIDVNNIKIHHNRIHGVANAIRVDNSPLDSGYYFVLKNLEIYENEINDNTSTGASSYAIAAIGSGGGRFKDLFIRDNILTDIDGQGVNISYDKVSGDTYEDNIHIEGNSFRTVASFPFLITATGSPVEMSGVFIENNSFYDTGTLVLSGVNLINKVFLNRNYGIFTGDALSFDELTNLTLEGNYFVATGNGPNLDGTNIKLKNNYLESASSFALRFNSGATYTDINNTVVGIRFMNATTQTVASAGTITPPAAIFHITGTSAIATINIPEFEFSYQVTIIPDAAFTTTDAGNIAKASTGVAGKALIMTYDFSTSKWYPSY